MHEMQNVIRFIDKNQYIPTIRNILSYIYSQKVGVVTVMIYPDGVP